MGYHIHITRGNWWEDKTDKITPEEWREVIEADTDFELWPGETEVYTLKMCEVRPAFSYSDVTGTIWVRAGYFEEVLPKVLEVAAKLGGIVQGDEGEFYRLTDQGRETFWENPDTKKAEP